MKHQGHYIYINNTLSLHLQKVAIKLYTVTLYYPECQQNSCVQSKAGVRDIVCTIQRRYTTLLDIYIQNPHLQNYLMDHIEILLYTHTDMQNNTSQCIRNSRE